MRTSRFIGRWTAALLALASLCAWGAPPSDPWAPYRSVWFDNVTVANGLPHSTVTAIAQDAHGVVWMGSFGGLVRYDGNQLKVFGEEPDAADGLSDAYIRALAPLPNGDLLVGTNAGGLTRFDAGTNRFHRYPAAGGDGTDKVFAIGSDRHGGWWLATDRGLEHLDDANGQLQAVPLGPGNRGNLPSRGFAVTQDAAGAVWVGTDQGLLRRAPGARSFELVRDGHHPRIDAILGDGIWSLLPDRNGRLWVGTQKSGSIYLDARGWHWVPGISGPEGATGRRTVRDILQTRTGDIWFASDGAGVATWSPVTGAVGILRHDPSVPSTIPGDITRSLMQDQAGNIWVSTELGAARHDTRADSVLTIPASSTQSHALTDPDVHTVFVDTRGRIWLGLGLGHIAVIDLADGSMHHLTLTGAQAQQDVQSFVMAPDGAIWVGAQGIARIDPDTFAITASVVPSMDSHLVLSLGRDGDDIYVASYEGLWRVAFSTRAADPVKLTSDEIRFMLRLPGRWWFPSINGISVLADGATTFTHIRHDATDPQSLPQNYTGTATFDDRGRLWLATYGGIAYLDPFRLDGPYRFGRIGTAEGLGSAKVNAVLVDHRNRVWASLTHGVAVVDPDTLKVRNLSTRDGLRVASYSHRSAAVGPNGEMMFGGLGGLTVVLPDAASAAQASAPLAVTDAFVDGQELSFRQLPGNGGSLEVGNVLRSIRIDFSLLDYAELGDTRYAYYLEGFDAGWVSVPPGNPPVAVYTNLPGGTFRLHLRAETLGAQGRTIISTVRLNVALRWYESSWARVLGVLLVLLVFGGLMRLRTAFLHRRAIQLQIQVDARTLDLQEANARLDQLAGTDELTGAYNRRRFLDLAHRAVERAHASKLPLSMVLIDLDDFKLVNDTYGHLAGDAVIRATMDLTASLCRDSDLVGRYGGEELILCLPDSDADGAWQLTERIRRALADASVTDDGHDIMFTASAGIAVLRGNEDLQAMLRRADDALYAAKNGGRNRSQIDTR